MAPHRANTPRLLLRAFGPQVCCKLTFMGGKEGGREGRGSGRGEGREEREERMVLQPSEQWVRAQGTH